MPTIQTGNPGWDQNLSTLGNALFPDPSKIGQGYYYGSEARKAQIEAARLQDQLAASHTATGMQFGHQPNPVYRQGAFQTNIMQEPFGPGGSTGAAVAAPPAPPGQPVQPAQAASTLANTVATTPPAALGTGIVAGFENAATTGPGGEPTGSNGSIPQNGPGPVHPGSVTSAGGGGVTYAPAAAKDGTPAPLDFNFAQNAALMAQGGLSAEVIKAVLPATIGNMVKNGQIPVQTGDRIAAYFGVPNMRVQEISNQGAAQVANIQAASHIAAQNIVTNENARQFNKTPRLVGDAATGAPPVYANQIDVAGKPAFEPSVAVQVQSQAGVYGNYFNPNTGKYEYTTAKDANARGLVEGAKSGDSQQQQMYQRYMAMPPGPDKDRMLMDIQAMASTPKEIDPKAQLQQEIVNYQKDNQIYAVPQKSVFGTISVKNPVAFDNGASEAINSRQAELARQPENRRLNPLELHEKAVNSLQQQGLPDGRRLPTPAEVVAMRAPVRSRIATAGMKGDPRLGTLQPPGGKGPATDHMIIHLMTPEEIAAQTGAETLKPTSGMTPAPAAVPAPTVAAPAAPAPATAATVPQTFRQKLGAVIGGTVPPMSGTLFGRPSGAVPAPATPAPAPPAPPPAGAPIGTAPAGTPDGPRTMGGKPVVVRGGLIYLQ